MSTPATTCSTLNEYPSSHHCLLPLDGVMMRWTSFGCCMNSKMTGKVTCRWGCIITHLLRPLLYHGPLLPNYHHPVPSDPAPTHRRPLISKENLTHFNGNPCPSAKDLKSTHTQPTFPPPIRPMPTVCAEGTRSARVEKGISGSYSTGSGAG